MRLQRENLPSFSFVALGLVIIHSQTEIRRLLDVMLKIVTAWVDLKDFYYWVVMKNVAPWVDLVRYTFHKNIINHLCLVVNYEAFLSIVLVTS